MFTFERVNKKSSVFDIKKLNWINSEYIKSEDEESVAKLVIEKLDEMKLSEDSKDLQYVKSVVGLMKERVSSVNDIIEFGNYFFEEPLRYDEKGITKHWNPKIKPVFDEYSGILKNTVNWAPDALEKGLREFADSKGVKAGELIHLLRLSLTGLTISPGIFDLMKLLGKDRVTQRIAGFLERILLIILILSIWIATFGLTNFN